ALVITCVSVLVFFFQAEDGIRVRNVTGVQTCALPISPPGCSCWRTSAAPRRSCRNESVDLVRRFQIHFDCCVCLPWCSAVSQPRSEERRVGKECRSRGEPVHN